MLRNGEGPALRVLLSGPAAEKLAAGLGEQPALKLIPSAESSRSGSSVDVALHVLASSSSPTLESEIKALRASCDAPLILAAYGAPNGIVESGLAVGASDVLVLPQPAETVVFALQKAARSNSSTAKGKVLTVFSPKGGSGKTVLATNIAVATAQAGTETLLVDLDLQFGDAALASGVTPRATIADLAGSSGEIDAEKVRAFVSNAQQPRLGLLAAPPRPEDAQILGQRELKAVLVSARSVYGAVVIDTGPLFDAAMLAALDCSDHLVVVCNPEITSLKNVRIGLETIDRLGFPRDRVSVVVNRVGAPGGVVRREIEGALEVDIAFELPDDPAVPAALNRAVPAVLADSGGRFSREIAKLAGALFLSEASVAPPEGRRRFLVGGRR
jgi:MinD-like ATPase involved in chromosome partitioning or flagellar assembly